MQKKYLILDILPTEWSELQERNNRQVARLPIMSTTISKELAESRLNIICKRGSSSALVYHNDVEALLAELGIQMKELSTVVELQAKISALEAQRVSQAQEFLGEKEKMETNLKRMALVIEKISQAVKLKDENIKKLEDVKSLL
jgi:predicted O-linked N-acetylglucosamine transferase (SPINDLY family)